ncbi:MAG: hypothetical protein AAFP07_19945 [Cyanobacteria bacterium J06606_4]
MQMCENLDTHPDLRCAPATPALVGIPYLGAHSLAPGTDAGSHRSREDLLQFLMLEVFDPLSLTARTDPLWRGGAQRRGGSAT